ncbi:MAG: nucleotide exchange factor GrpE [Fidelibacterota bacterium]
MSSKQTRKMTGSEKRKTIRKKSATPGKKLIKELDSLKKEFKELQDRHLRLKAEFENFRRRKEKEIIDLLTYDGAEVIKLFLPVIDDLERLSAAVEQNSDSNSKKLKEGVQLILNKIQKRFNELKVKPFAEPGEVLDPNLHDALMMKAEKGKQENEILEVFEKGYRYKNRVIRHAKVVVNQTPS